MSNTTIYRKPDQISTFNDNLTIAGGITVKGPLTINGNPQPNSVMARYEPYLVASTETPNEDLGNVGVPNTDNSAYYQLINSKLCYVTVNCSWTAFGPDVSTGAVLASLYLPFAPAYMSNDMVMDVPIQFTTGVNEETNILQTYRQHARLRLRNSTGRNAIIYSHGTPANSALNSSVPVYLNFSTPSMKSSGKLRGHFFYPVNEPNHYEPDDGLLTSIKRDTTQSVTAGGVNVLQQFKALGGFTHSSALNQTVSSFTPRFVNYDNGDLLNIGVVVNANYVHTGNLCFLKVYYQYTGNVATNINRVGLTLPVEASASPTIQYFEMSVANAMDGITNITDPAVKRKRRALFRINNNATNLAGEFRYYTQNVGGETNVRSQSSGGSLPFFRSGNNFSLTIIYQTLNAA